MTLDEAIAHAREVASVQKDRCEQCAADHEQLAEWLEELKDLRQAVGGAKVKMSDLGKTYTQAYNDWLDKHDKDIRADERKRFDELSEKVEKLEHEKRALENRCYALNRGLACNFCAVDGCRYNVKKEQKDDRP